MRTVTLYTDGSCWPKNPGGTAGWAAIMVWDQYRREFSGSEPASTNNRAELLAAINGLDALKEPCAVTIVTDSQYVQKGITQWIGKWKSNGWRTAARQPVKNKDLWQKLDTLVQHHFIKWEWIRGHTGHPENEQCDALARHAAQSITHNQEPQS